MIILIYCPTLPWTSLCPITFQLYVIPDVDRQYGYLSCDISVYALQCLTGKADKDKDLLQKSCVFSLVIGVVEEDIYCIFIEYFTDCAIRISQPLCCLVRGRFAPNCNNACKLM